ncbi:MAG: phosphoribosylformylglycinamidine cyclo-ligase [Elusimicrobia bacterium GWA2_69_24]|nr:MAG: phosphoribosylformylglycinamidine cyclo-ligase [Elusimicrobia bacterium GWA2_69_24]HBL15927.1 phosphoribosylformylglycinamidine cyclo-ligase [Elusimicrobiota bacterium]
MLTYKKAGVDIDAADKLVEFIQKKAPAIGGFSGLYPIDGGETFLAATTDGVGTKLKLAFALDRHETIGIDLVAMCVNDLLTVGARPLFFLDYYAMGKLDLAKSKRILSGILEGCRQGGLALLGGETAEMPGFYAGGEYDLAGFAVGIVSKGDVIDGSKIFPGDLVVGLPSSGVHSNGFSLVRKVFDGRHLRRRAAKLLTPTRIYTSAIRRLMDGFRKRRQLILGMAHITGGGIPENLPRVLPPRTKAVIRPGSWRIPAVFGEIQKRGKVPEAEMWRTFNMGIGMVLVIRPNSLDLARRLNPELIPIGRIEAGEGEPQVVLEAP